MQRAETRDLVPRCPSLNSFPGSATSLAGPSAKWNQAQALLSTGSCVTQTSLTHEANPALSTAQMGKMDASLNLKPKTPGLPLTSPVTLDMSLSFSEPQSPLPASGFIMPLFSLLWSCDCLRLQTEIGSCLIEKKKGLTLCLPGARSVQFLDSRTVRSHPPSR